MIFGVLRKWRARRDREKRLIKTDVCVIGSGPFNLVRAIQELKAGKSVTVVERETVLGGAWATRASFVGNTARHDVVAHLISPFPKAHELLEATGFRLEQRPIYFWDAACADEKKAALDQLADDAFVPYSSNIGHLMGWHQYYGLLKYPQGLDAAKAEANAARATFLGFSYFERSFQPLIDALTEHFVRLGGKSLTGQNVMTLDFDESHALVGLAEREISAGKIISGRHLHCRISVNGREEQEDIVTNEYNSLMMLVRLPTAPEFRYINVVNHAYIGAIQVAPYAFDADLPGTYCYCVIGSFDKSKPATEIAEAVINQFRQSGLVDAAAALLDAALHHYVSYSHSSAYFERVQCQTERLEINIVNSIGQCMSDHYDSWSEALT
jgi:hypothetical protein